MIRPGSVAVAYCTPSWKRMTSLLVVILLATSLAWTQATTSLRGTVTDPDGKAVIGANVVLANAESRTERTVTTGNQGEYQFLLVPSGSYTLTVKAAGFRGYEQRDLVLLVNTPATANVQLKVGAATEILTVTSEAPAINLVDASLGNSFNETQVQDIPLEGRNVPDLLSLQAGVSYTGNRIGDKDQDTRNGAVNGARSDQSNVTLDNVDVNDQSNGYAFTSVLPVTQDSVQEFRVTTTNYGADQGQGSGAQVALVTRSGTNAFHGALYEDLRNTITSANDYLVKQSEQNIGLPNKPLQLNRNIFGAAIGGPIQKDRLFFFANYEGTREREEQRAERVIPTPSMCQGFLNYQYLKDPNDPKSIATQTFSPSDLQNLDPKGIGIDPAMLDLANHTGYLDRTFCTGQTPTNDLSAGDGLNYAGYVFRAPTKLDNDVFIARVDYHLTANGKHNLFWRGNLNDLRNPGAPFLPGKYQTLPGELDPSAPMQRISDHSKGFALGYIVVLSPTMVNSFHWGYTRQSFGVIGNTNQQWNTFLGLDQGINFSHNFQLPLHNFVDDFSWTKGTHSFQFGTSIKIARNPRTSFLHSNTLALGTTNWTSPIGFAGTSSTLDPTNVGAPEPVSATQYDRPLLSLYGMISDVVANYNLDRGGNVVPGVACPGGTCGAPVNRRYGLDSYEFYGQDTWRIKPNLTLTYGLRWSFFPAPWETNGFQASTTFGLGTQFAQNVRNMNQGIGYGAMDSIDFSPSGPANNGPGFYPLEKTDWSPRVSIAYSPRFNSGPFKKIFGDNDRTVIRAGFSRVYDRAGFALINSFDQVGASGFSTTLQNTCCTFGVTSAENLPRITGINAIPVNNIDGVKFLQDPPPPGFPQKTIRNSQSNLWGTDNTLKTPHAYTADFSIGRELPHRFSLQVSYVGRFGRDLLTQRDLTQPLNIKDPISGIDYYTAASALSTLARKFARDNNGGNPTNYYQAAITPAQIASIKASDPLLGNTAQYWVNMLPALRPGATVYTDPFSGFVPNPGTSVTDSLIESVFDLYYNPLLSVIGDEIVGLADIDSYGGLNDDANTGSYFFKGPAGLLGTGSGQFLNNQAFSMYGWSSVGSSSYHALQVNLRKQVSHGIQFDLNYSWSKSIDVTSAASRVGFSVYGYQNVGLVGTRLANAFSPNLARAVSDFDTTHQFNLNWIAELPVGKGRALAGNANAWLDAIIGGWQTSGVARWTSGFPFSIDGGQRWPTDWFLTGLGQMTAKPRTGTYKRAGRVDLFADPQAAQQDFTLPLPGGVGSRNVLRGNGYADWDMSLYKSWKMPYRETHSVQFRWDVFNVPNLTRFNPQSVGSSALLTSLAQQSTNFGAYTSLLTQPRVMQFALRYEF
ncbi:MAG TPA: carboxypeptidase-like regulatory domain-containing protein [Terriglobales bacterium]|nr:carboxypeptidase-like regulatory domain-containing protein [Terriglobales bacterium]